MAAYFDLIQQAVKANLNKETAIPMKAYMRDQFEFAGIKTPVRKEIIKQLVATYKLPPYTELIALTKELRKQPEREYQYLAIEFLIKQRKHWDEQLLPLIEQMIVTKSWWDTVDAIATNIAGPWFKKFPSFQPATTNKWINSPNMWLQRSAILFQNTYKKETDEKLLYAYINKCSKDKEFFIQKAIGWALREYSKTNPRSVKEFVEANTLAPLSVREAVRKINL
jgi:3-methyladenine DNA glycosylase AlkD